VPRVRYDGRGRLRVFGHELRHNEVCEMTEDEAAALVASPHTNVTVLGVTVHGTLAASGDTHEEEE